MAELRCPKGPQVRAQLFPPLENNAQGSRLVSFHFSTEEKSIHWLFTSKPFRNDCLNWLILFGKASNHQEFSGLSALLACRGLQPPTSRAEQFMALQEAPAPIHRQTNNFTVSILWYKTPRG